MRYESAVETVGLVLDIVGVIAIVVGLVVALAMVRFRDDRDTYTALRQRIGRAILLGLEILVAADIIRTVAADLTFRSVGVLGLIVLIRTFLSFTLEVELSGRWPWQRAAD